MDEVRFAGLMDMVVFCVYVSCLAVFVVLVLPQAFYLFLNVNVFSGMIAFIFVGVGLVWLVNQIRKMVMK